MLRNKGGVTGVRPAGPRPILPGLLPARERSELVQRSGAATIDGKRTADVPDTRGQRRPSITRSRGSCDSQATSAPTGSGRYSIRSRQPRTGRDSQGAASLQPLDLHTLLKKRPRAADPIVEITGLVVRGVGQSQQCTISVNLNKWWWRPCRGEVLTSLSLLRLAVPTAPAVPR